jgi:type II secretory pathway pseudopilin PulG
MVIETLVVATVIAALAGVLGPRLGRYVERKLQEKNDAAG